VRHGRDARARSRFLLQGAIAYTLDIVGCLGADSLSAPTPCPSWDVHDLLHHLIDGLIVISGGIATGRILPVPGPAVGPVDPVTAFSTAACNLLTLPVQPSHRILTIADAALPVDLATVTGALEVAVHGWDIAQACGHPRRIPRIIAADMLELAPLLVPAITRPTLFAAPVPVPAQAPPGDHLLAFLGRAPGRS
jgi:uncharacterized protein (TIGR03086 family)